MRGMKIHLFGGGELDGICKSYKINIEDVVVNNFGVDLKFWTPSAECNHTDFVLSIGNDALRDYDLLVDIARHSNEKFIIITKRNLGQNIPQNVKIVRGSWDGLELSDLEIKKLYHQAKYIIVPLKQGFQPSGQSVSLQAMACGKAVIMTKTKGIWDTTNLINEMNIILVDPGCSDQLFESMEKLNASSLRRNIGYKARCYAEKHANIEQFAERILESINRFSRG